METIKAKLAKWSQDKGLIKCASILAALLIILLCTCCISIFMRANIQKKYSSTIQQLQEQCYQNLTTMTELFSRIDDPNVDVRYKLIPELKAQYTAVTALNSVLQASGDEHALLTTEQIDDFAAAFDLYANAFQRGSATGLAKADMAACMENVELLVQKHNAPNTKEEDIVIINASSGKVESTQSTAAN